MNSCVCICEAIDFEEKVPNASNKLLNKLSEIHQPMSDINETTTSFD